VAALSSSDCASYVHGKMSKSDSRDYICVLGVWDAENDNKCEGMGAEIGVVAGPAGPGSRLSAAGGNGGPAVLRLWSARCRAPLAGPRPGFQ
jgi:hypothetical protein